jgi:hypothetical protein
VEDQSGVSAGEFRRYNHYYEPNEQKRASDFKQRLKTKKTTGSQSPKLPASFDSVSRPNRPILLPISKTKLNSTYTWQLCTLV